MANKNLELIARLVELAGEAEIRCEWPGIRTYPNAQEVLSHWRSGMLGADECRWHPSRPFGEVAHVRARGMGGARRRDTPDNLVVLCRRHHQIVDNVLGQGPITRRWLRAEVIGRRPPWFMAELEKLSK